MAWLGFFLVSFTDFYFIHYADPQIGRNAYAYPYCTLAVHQINRLRPAPRFLLVAGDMADDPTNPATVMSQWQTCDSLFDLLPMSKYYVPGNNDLGYADEACWTPAQLALYRSFWGPDYFSLDRDSCHIIGLNSTLLDTYAGHACYSSSLEQDSFLRSDLAGLTPGQCRHVFLFFHFPLYLSSPTEGNTANNVDRPRRDTILNYLIKHRLTAVATGHLHYDLMNFYGPALLQSGLATCETNIGACGYRPVKVFRNGIETFTIFLNAPQDTIPLVQIVRPSVQPETAQAGNPVNFTCAVDSLNFPDWRGLTYRWQFGDGQTSSAPNTVHAYADTGHYQVVFSAYKSPRLASQYYFTVVVATDQVIVENQPTSSQNPVLWVLSNPFREQTEFRCALHGARYADLKIYDMTGKLIKDLSTAVPDHLATIDWEGTDQTGRLVPAGIYFVNLKIENKSFTEKIIKLP